MNMAILLSVGLPLLGTAVFLAIFLPLLFRFLRNHPAAKTILYFYTNLQQHNYAAAFECIGSNSPYHVGSFSNQPLSAFTNAAKQMEEEMGEIRSFGLTARMSIENGTAQYQLKVARERGGEYIVQFLLMKGAYGWKIISFDRL
jgi:hypothetical protein